MLYSDLCAGVVNGMRILYVGLEEDLEEFCRLVRINKIFVKKVWNSESIQSISPQFDADPQYVAVIGNPNPRDWRNTRDIMEQIRVKNIPILEAANLVNQSLVLNPPGFWKANGRGAYSS